MKKVIQDELIREYAKRIKSDYSDENVIAIYLLDFAGKVISMYQEAQKDYIRRRLEEEKIKPLF